MTGNLISTNKDIFNRRNNINGLCLVVLLLKLCEFHEVSDSFEGEDANFLWIVLAYLYEDFEAFIKGCYGSFYFGEFG
jgi:hypothetical protein